jgi:hypothetical protein
MKRLFFAILAAVLFAGIAHAQASGPYLVVKPSSGVPTSYTVTGATWIASPVAALTDGTLSLNLTSAPVGSTTLTISGCITDTVWGQRCSIPVNFTVTPPVPPILGVPTLSVTPGT